MSDVASWGAGAGKGVLVLVTSTKRLAGCSTDSL